MLAALAVLNTPALLPAVGLASLAAAVIGRRWYPLLAPLTAAALVALETVAKYGSLQGSPYLAEAERGFRTVMPYSGEPGFSYPLFFRSAIDSLLFRKVACVLHTRLVARIQLKRPAVFQGLLRTCSNSGGSGLLCRTHRDLRSMMGMVRRRVLGTSVLSSPVVSCQFSIGDRALVAKRGGTVPTAGKHPRCTCRTSCAVGRYQRLRLWPIWNGYLLG